MGECVLRAEGAGFKTSLVRPGRATYTVDSVSGWRKERREGERRKGEGMGGRRKGKKDGKLSE